jgi:hypothetical protein
VRAGHLSAGERRGRNARGDVGAGGRRDGEARDPTPKRHICENGGGPRAVRATSSSSKISYQRVLALVALISSGAAVVLARSPSTSPSTARRGTGRPRAA